MFFVSWGISMIVREARASRPATINRGFGRDACARRVKNWPPGCGSRTTKRSARASRTGRRSPGRCQRWCRNILWCATWSSRWSLGGWWRRLRAPSSWTMSGSWARLASRRSESVRLVVTSGETFGGKGTHTNTRKQTHTHTHTHHAQTIYIFFCIGFVFTFMYVSICLFLSLFIIFIFWFAYLSIHVFIY